MAATGLSRRVLLLGYFDRANVGDDLMRDALLGALPPLLPSRYHIEARRLPPLSPRGLIEAVRLLPRLARADLVLLAGGSHFHDRFGWRSIRILALLLGLVGVARLGGARVGYAGVGVGPLGSRPSRALVRRLLRLADAVLVRDARSARLCRALGVRNSVVEGLDLALLLPPPVALPTAGVACLTLGVSVIPYFREFEREEASDARVVESLSHALARLACETSFRVVVLPFFDPPGDVERGDRAMSERLAARLTRDSVDASLGGSSVEQVRAAISDCDVLLATRYHAALLAYVAAKPAVVVTYDAKCSSLADQLGVPPRARLSPRELLDTTLVETRLRALLRAPSDFEATLPLEEARARTETALSAFVSALTSDAEPR